MSPKEVLEFAAANNVKMVDLRFTDLPGLWHHVSYPIHELEEASFEEGFGMDGSSIRGWAAIHESDMLLVPDPSWYTLDPFTDTPTLVMIGDIIDPVTKQHYVRDPRNIAKKAETYLAYTGIADKAYFGAEAEFFILVKADVVKDEEFRFRPEIGLVGNARIGKIGLGFFGHIARVPNIMLLGDGIDSIANHH